MIMKAKFVNHAAMQGARIHLFLFHIAALISNVLVMLTEMLWVKKIRSHLKNQEG